MHINWIKEQAFVATALDKILVFGAGALLDPSVRDFIGTHQGIATAATIGLAVLRSVDKALGGKAGNVPLPGSGPPRHTP